MTRTLEREHRGRTGRRDRERKRERAGGAGTKNQGYTVMSLEYAGGSTEEASRRNKLTNHVLLAAQVLIGEGTRQEVAAVAAGNTQHTRR